MDNILENGLKIGGLFHFKLVRNGRVVDEWEDKNLITNEGLNHILNAVLHAATQITTWYVGVFEANATPLATWTGANVAANATESTAYDETTRPAYVEAASTAQSTTNLATPAQFTINATKTIYGAFLISTNTKADTAGVLLAAAKFSVARAVQAGDLLLVDYTISAASA